MPSYLDEIAPEDLNGKLRVALGYPNHGWVLMALLATPYNQSVVIHCSDVFEPFTGMVWWLTRIANADLPVELEIDEEGRFKHLIAQATDAADVIEFRVTDGENQTLMRCRLDRTALLREFSRSLRAWLRDQYDRAKFRPGVDLRSLNFEVIDAKINQ
jgi:hypothetical protein